MNKQLWARIYLDGTTNVKELWERVAHFTRTNLGGEGGQMIIYFTGSINDGFEVLKLCSQFGCIKAELQTQL